MSKGVAGAIALILLWFAFISFFIAFHPGGIRDDMFVDATNNPTGLARNPRDVLLYFVKQWSEGIQGTETSGTAV